MSAMLPTESKSPSRRALLAGALGGLGAWAAGAIGRANPVRAEGEAIVVGGQYNTATSATEIYNFANDATVFDARSLGSGVGVFGGSNTHWGVEGSSETDAGVYGVSGTGWGVKGVCANVGVLGSAGGDKFSKGVVGQSPAGHAIHGSTTTGYAGYFEGRVFTSKFYEMREIPTPPAPTSASRARVFVRQSGGKTQLCVRFATGDVKVLATED